MPNSPNLNQLLLASNDWLAAEILKGVQRSTYSSLTPAQARLLAIMAGQSASISDLARRLGLSRQAVHKTVSELERRGILQVKTDPERANAKLVSYTQLGKEVNRAGARIIDDIEVKIAKRIGKQGVDQLKLLLANALG
jgi:DNA-binding MarR family transcriptional regulator